jgi:hypothetical protein
LDGVGESGLFGADLHAPAAMFGGCRSSNAVLLLVPVSPCKVWRGSLARNPGLVL